MPILSPGLSKHPIQNSNRVQYFEAKSHPRGPLACIMGIGKIETAHPSGRSWQAPYRNSTMTQMTASLHSTLLLLLFLRLRDENYSGALNNSILKSEDFVYSIHCIDDRIRIYANYPYVPKDHVGQAAQWQFGVFLVHDFLLE